MSKKSVQFLQAFRDELPRFFKGIPHANPNRKGIVFEPHQAEQMQRIFRKTVEHIRSGNRHRLAASIVATCGSGKTLAEMAVVLASQIAQQKVAPGEQKKDIVVTSGRPEAIGICEQYGDLGYRTSRLGGGEKDTQASILIANIQALQSYISQGIFVELVPHGTINTAVLDEADLHLTSKRKEVQKHLSPQILLGGTATEEWPDGRNISELFGEPVSRLDIMSGIRQRINAKPLFRLYEAAIDESTLRISKEDYDPVILSGAMKAAEIHKAILEVYRDIVPEGMEKEMPTLIYVPSVHLVRQVEKTLNGALPEDVTAVGWVGQDLENGELEAWMQMFKDGDVQIVVMCEMGGRGMNLENAHLLIDAYPTLSLNKMQQRDGRVLRKIREGSSLWKKGWRKQNAVIAQIVPHSNNFRPAIFTDLLGGHQAYEKLIRSTGGNGGGAPIQDMIDRLRKYIESKKPFHEVELLGDLDIYDKIKRWDELQQADASGFLYMPRSREERDQ